MSAFAVIVVAATLVTSVLSGIFGMAGGLILMGLLGWLLPVQSAFALHGVIQFISNAWRAVLHRRYLAWRVLLPFGVGAAVAIAVLSLVAFAPTQFVLFLGLGLMPILVWIPERWLRLDASRLSHAAVAGLLSTGLSLVSGVSGPVTDLFFIRTKLTRYEVIATKAVMQAIGHASKVLVYGAILLTAESLAEVSIALVGVSIFASMVGIMLGRVGLDRISEAHFRAWRRWLVTAIGLAFLFQAAVIAIEG